MNPDNPTFRTEAECSLIIKLQNEIEQLKAENENQAKTIHDIGIESTLALRSQVRQLKSKLEIAKKGLEFYGDRESYVEDQEFHTIDSLNNDDEFLEKYQARVGGKKARQALKEIEG